MAGSYNGVNSRHTTPSGWEIHSKNQYSGPTLFCCITFYSSGAPHGVSTFSIPLFVCNSQPATIVANLPCSVANNSQSIRVFFPQQRFIVKHDFEAAPLNGGRIPPLQAVSPLALKSRNGLLYGFLC